MSAEDDPNAKRDGMADTEFVSGSGDKAADAMSDTEIATDSNTLLAVSPGLADTAPTQVAWSPGSKIGHFEVIELLGVGGMGIVLAARDTQLDRKVAIKMLRSRVTANHQARLEREAKAMAKLSHPNVVTVHEVGAIDDQLFIAMEFVDGQTLGKWLRENKPSFSEIVTVMVDAGKGLAAAHGAGMVHRDFKPDNVLVGNDGRVRVSDFGLVSDIGQVIEKPTKRSPTAKPDQSGSLTETGAIMGTPLYMAPEQHLGEPADAKADQFSFCVTMWEAFYDQTPYSADTYPELVSNVIDGVMRAPPKDATVPSWIRTILMRGLATDPGARFASMDELLEALQKDPRRNLKIGAAAAVLLAVAGIAVVATQSVVGDDREPCTGSAGNLAGVWDAPRKAQVRNAFLAVDKPYSEETFNKAAAGLDEYSASWVKMHTETCRATHVREEQSPELFDLRMHCLDRRLNELRSLTTLFTEQADEQVVSNAVKAVRGIGDLSGCADTEQLRAIVPLPDDPAARERIAQLRARIDEAESLEIVGSYEPARAIATEVAELAKPLKYSPLLAEALVLRAGLEHVSGDYKAAEASFRESAAAAAEAHDDPRLARSYIDLIYVLYQQGRYDEALSFSSVAETSAARVGSDPKLHARLANNIGTVYLAQGKYPKAREQYQKALDIQLEFLGEEDNPLLAPALSNLGTTLWYTGDIPGASEHFQRAYDIMEKDLGADHPSLAYILRNLGDAAVAQGKYDEAIPKYRRATAIWESSLGPDHPNVALAIEQLAYALGTQGEYDEAIALGTRALKIREKHFGPDHALVGQVLGILGSVLMSKGDTKAAIEHFERGLKIQEATLGKEHNGLCFTLDRLADAAEKAGTIDAARGYRQRTLTIRRKAMGDHNDTAYSHFMLGMLELSQKEHSKAAANFTSAKRIWTKLSPDDPDLHKATFGLAQAKWGAGKRKAAVALANEALAALKQGELHDEIAAWLAKR